MPSEPLHPAFDALRARLQAQLDGQLVTVREVMDEADRRHRQALDAASLAAATEVERQWSARLDALPPAWASKLRAAIADPSSTSAVGSADAGQASASSASVARPAAAPDPSLPLLRGLASSARTMSMAQSLTGVLDALADGAAAIASRASLLLVNGGTGARAAMLERWRPAGFAGQEQLPPASVLAVVLRSRRSAKIPMPAVADTAAAGPAGDHGLLVPVVVGGQTVAVLYSEGDRSPQVHEMFEILGSHAGACLSHLTAMRTAQALGLGWTTSARPGDPPAANGDHDGSARRYARLLVSEIKLYNESAVRTGRERRDLLVRLGPEIDRARRLYEERIPASLGDRAAVFQQELVQTLAAGNPDLLGASA